MEGIEVLGGWVGGWGWQARSVEALRPNRYGMILEKIVEETHIVQQPGFLFVVRLLYSFSVMS